MYHKRSDQSWLQPDQSDQIWHLFGIPDDTPIVSVGDIGDISDIASKDT